MKFVCFYTIVHASLFASISATFLYHANVGVMYSMFNAAGEKDMAGIMQLTGMQIALDHINNKTDGVADDLLPSVELRMAAQAPLPTFTSGAAAAIEMTGVEHRKGVIACAGPGSIEAMRGKPTLDIATLSVFTGIKRRCLKSTTGSGYSDYRLPFQ